MMIETLLDTDLYKFTMQQVVFHQFPSVQAEYLFQCRNKEVDLSPYAEEIKAEIERFCDLRFKTEEIDYLASLTYFKPDYLNELRRFRLDSSSVSIDTSNGFELRIKGEWFNTILFEVPLLAIINEIYFKNQHPDAPMDSSQGWTRLINKRRMAMNSDQANFKIIEFGTRRRYSRAWQAMVVEHLHQRMKPHFLGTSNVSLAKSFGLKCYGTMAHEFLQAFQAFTPVQDFQQAAFESWMREYRGSLGIALSDVVGMEAFFKDFDRLFCKVYDGARHDSGDPKIWGERLIAHYQSLRIDPLTKTAVFTDGLNFDKALELAKHFEGRIQTQFGIGTNLTNDFGFPALNIVIKLVRCNGRPVAKLSDSPGKTISEDPAYVEYLKSVFG